MKVRKEHEREQRSYKYGRLVEDADTSQIVVLTPCERGIGEKPISVNGREAAFLHGPANDVLKQETGMVVRKATLSDYRSSL